MNTAN